MKKVLLLLFVVFTYSGINAQIIIKTEYFGTSSYRMTEGDTDEKVGNSKGSAIVYQGLVNIPLSMKSDENNRLTMFGISGSVAYAKLNNRNFTEPLVIDDILNMGISLNYMRPVSRKWSMMATIGGGLYMPTTRLSQISRKHILGSIGAIFICHLKPNLEVGGGIALNNSFGFPMVFPAFYFSWMTEGRYSVKVALMNGMDISAGYNMNENVSLNIVLEMNGQMALLEMDGKNKMFSHQYIVTGFRPEIKIGGKVTIPITAGIHAMRPAELTNRSLKSIFQDRGYYFQVSPYISAGIQIGF